MKDQKRYRCAACGWTGRSPEITPSREEVCPVCNSDELDLVEPAGKRKRILVELLMAGAR